MLYNCICQLSWSRWQTPTFSSAWKPIKMSGHVGRGEIIVVPWYLKCPRSALVWILSVRKTSEVSRFLQNFQADPLAHPGNVHRIAHPEKFRTHRKFFLWRGKRYQHPFLKIKYSPSPPFWLLSFADFLSKKKCRVHGTSPPKFQSYAFFVACLFVLLNS